MSIHLYDELIHQTRAAEFESAARQSAMTSAIRRARRLDLAARMAERWSAWADNLARRLSARARVSRARLL